MDRTVFETELREQGYAEIVDRRMEANALNPEHAHEFDAPCSFLTGPCRLPRTELSGPTAPAILSR